MTNYIRFVIFLVGFVLVACEGNIPKRQVIPGVWFENLSNKELWSDIDQVLVKFPDYVVTNLVVEVKDELDEHPEHGIVFGTYHKSKYFIEIMHRGDSAWDSSLAHELAHHWVFMDGLNLKDHHGKEFCERLLSVNPEDGFCKHRSF